METIFLKILRREVPAEIIYETDTVLAFLDIEPTNKGHVLVIPKEWSRNMLAIEKESWIEVMEVVRILAPHIQKAVGADGVNVMINNEAAAGQIIFHTHVHIVPRFTNDGFKHWPGTPYPEGEMKQVAKSIRGEIERII